MIFVRFLQILSYSLCLRVFVLSLKKSREFIPFDDVLPSNLSSNGLQSIIE